jgi:hypothetical protein
MITIKLADQYQFGVRLIAIRKHQEQFLLLISCGQYFSTLWFIYQTG